MRRRILATIFAVLVVAGVVAAGAVLWVGDDSDDGGVEASDSGAAPSRVPDPTTTTLPPPTTTTTIGRRGSGQPVTFAFAGDIHFEGVLSDKLAADPASVLAPIAPVLGAADLTVANLETAVTEGGTPAAEGVHVPGTAVGAHRARRRRHRRREHGEQPRHGLRPGRARGLAHRGDDAAASRSSGSVTTRPRRMPRTRR